MLKPPTIDAIRAALGLLEVEGFDELADESGWPALQRQAADNHRRLALGAHPDRGGSTDRMAELNAAATLIKSVNLKRITRAPRIRSRRRGPGFDPFNRPGPDINDMFRDLTGNPFGRMFGDDFEQVIEQIFKRVIWEDRRRRSRTRQRSTNYTDDNPYAPPGWVHRPTSDGGDQYYRAGTEPPSEPPKKTEE